MNTKNEIISLAKQYETACFINGDPSWFMHQVDGQANQELLAFIASTLSFGARKQFMPKIQDILDSADNDVFSWLKNGKYEKFIQPSNKSFYRVVNCDAMYRLFCELQRIIEEYGTLKNFVSSAANSTGWWVRIIPDKAPILIPEGDSNREGIGMFDAMNSIGVHEMVIESPDHATTISNATPNQVKEIIWAYKQRILELKKNPRYKHFMIVKNHGAGLSALSHAHSHIIATPIIPKRIEEELEGAREYFHYHDRCLICDIVKQESRDKSRLVYEDENFIVFCPFASRFPFEMQIAPKSHQPYVHSPGTQQSQQ